MTKKFRKPTKEDIKIGLRIGVGRSKEPWNLKSKMQYKYGVIKTEEDVQGVLKELDECNKYGILKIRN